MNSNDTGDNLINVAVRIRPLLKNEIKQNSSICVFKGTSSDEVILGNDRKFSFDTVYDGQSSQSDIFENSIIPLIDQSFKGYNATILAYGQTGSGKTYTMGTLPYDNVESVDVGILPRSFQKIFEMVDTIKDNQKESSISISCSYLEIYSEDIRDLFDPYGSNKITIRENQSHEIFLTGIQTIEVLNFHELLFLLKKGSLSRVTKSTTANATSSRSHAIFTVYIDQFLTKNGGENEKLSSKFNFVDLAGCERQKSSNNESIVLHESISINKGLLCLGNVINALSGKKKQGQFVPYRQSKLTRILQDSIGGTAKTLMIACLNPTSNNYNLSLNTLLYACKTNSIVNNVVVNCDPTSKEIANLRKEIIELKYQLEEAEKKASQSLNDNIDLPKLIREESSKEVKYLKHKINQLEVERDFYKYKSLSIDNNLSSNDQINIMINKYKEEIDQLHIQNEKQFKIIQQLNRIILNIDINKYKYYSFNYELLVTSKYKAQLSILEELSKSMEYDDQSIEPLPNDINITEWINDTIKDDIPYRSTVEYFRDYFGDLLYKKQQELTQIQVQQDEIFSSYDYINSLLHDDNQLMLEKVESISALNSNSSSTNHLLQNQNSSLFFNNDSIISQIKATYNNIKTSLEEEISNIKMDYDKLNNHYLEKEIIMDGINSQHELCKGLFTLTLERNRSIFHTINNNNKSHQELLNFYQYKSNVLDKVEKLNQLKNGSTVDPKIVEDLNVIKNYLYKQVSMEDIASQIQFEIRKRNYIIKKMNKYYSNQFESKHSQTKLPIELYLDQFSKSAGNREEGEVRTELITRIDLSKKKYSTSNKINNDLISCGIGISLVGNMESDTFYYDAIFQYIVDLKCRLNSTLKSLDSKTDLLCEYKNQVEYLKNRYSSDKNKLSTDRYDRLKKTPDTLFRPNSAHKMKGTLSNQRIQFSSCNEDSISSIYTSLQNNTNFRIFSNNSSNSTTYLSSSSSNELNLYCLSQKHSEINSNFIRQQNRNTSNNSVTRNNNNNLNPDFNIKNSSDNYLNIDSIDFTTNKRNIKNNKTPNLKLSRFKNTNQKSRYVVGSANTKSILDQNSHSNKVTATNNSTNHHSIQNKMRNSNNNNNNNNSANINYSQPANFSSVNSGSKNNCLSSSTIIPNKIIDYNDLESKISAARRKLREMNKSNPLIPL